MSIRSHIDRYNPLNWSLIYKGMLVLVLALVLMPAAISATSDTFSDVPDNNFAHAAINAIFGARITTGISPGIYGPGQNVTREQMAAFLQRGLSRVAYDTRTLASLSGTAQDAAVVTITTGGAPGGTGFVKLDASLAAYNAFETGCPCEVQFYIKQDNSSNSSSNSYETVYNDIGGVDSNISGSLTWAVLVPTSSTQTFRLQVKRNNGTAGLATVGALTAVYIPFGSTGTTALSTQPIEAKDATEAQEVKPQTDKNNK